jgi:hypothetical protein
MLPVLFCLWAWYWKATGTYKLVELDIKYHANSRQPQRYSLLIFIKANLKVYKYLVIHEVISEREETFTIDVLLRS